MALQVKRLLCQHEGRSPELSDGQDGGPPVVLVCAGGGAGTPQRKLHSQACPKQRSKFS